MAITSNGTAQWKFQRLANLLTVIAGSVLLATFFCANIESHKALSDLVSGTSFKVFFAISLVVLALNSILAGWQIAGDYAQKLKMPVSFFVVIIVCVSLAYLVYGLCLLF